MHLEGPFCNALAFTASVELAITALDAIIANRLPVSSFRALFTHGSPAMDTDRNCWRLAKFAGFVFFKLSCHRP
jgi:hypothetical protein